MKVDDLQDALNLVDDDFIENVEKLRNRKKRKNNWTKWISLVACFACFCVIVIATKGFNLDNFVEEEIGSEKNTEECATVDNENYQETEVVQATEEVAEETSSIKIPKFSYEEEKQELLKNGDVDVIENGFQNIEKNEVTDRLKAIELAKIECTIEYNQVDVEYDELADMWKVIFSTKEAVGGCQTVYLSGEGITDLIVYGE